MSLWKGKIFNCSEFHPPWHDSSCLFSENLSYVYIRKMLGHVEEQASSLTLGYIGFKNPGNGHDPRGKTLVVSKLSRANTTPPCYTESSLFYLASVNYVRIVNAVYEEGIAHKEDALEYLIYVCIKREFGIQDCLKPGITSPVRCRPDAGISGIKIELHGDIKEWVICI